MSTTPITDRLEAELERGTRDVPVRVYHVMRKLESERTELREALVHALQLLRVHVEPDDLGGSRFDLTDCTAMKPVFAALEATAVN